VKGIRGVRKIEDGYNPATWMLEVTTPAQELALGIDFADSYKNSDLYRWVQCILKGPNFSLVNDHKRQHSHRLQRVRLTHPAIFQEKQGFDQRIERTTS